jgi:hypothetical protein
VRRRKIAGHDELEAAFVVARERVARLLVQKGDDIGKLYTLHAPEVECIAKGKPGHATIASKARYQTEWARFYEPPKRKSHYSRATS